MSKTILCGTCFFLQLKSYCDDLNPSNGNTEEQLHQTKQFTVNFNLKITVLHKFNCSAVQIDHRHPQQHQHFRQLIRHKNLLATWLLAMPWEWTWLAKNNKCVFWTCRIYHHSLAAHTLSTTQHLRAICFLKLFQVHSNGHWISGINKWPKKQWWLRLI